MLVGGGFAFANQSNATFQSPTHYNNAAPNQPTNWIEIPEGKKVSSCDNAARECTGVMLDGVVQPTLQQGFATLSDI